MMRSHVDGELNGGSLELSEPFVVKPAHPADFDNMGMEDDEDDDEEMAQQDDDAPSGSRANRPARGGGRGGGRGRGRGQANAAEWGEGAGWVLLLMRIIFLIPRLAILYPVPISGYSSRQMHWEAMRHVMFYITTIYSDRVSNYC